MDNTTQREGAPKQSQAGHGETVAPGCDIPAQSHPTAAQVERCQERLASLASSIPYAAPEAAGRLQREASECLNTIARYFGLRGSQSADATAAEEHIAAHVHVYGPHHGGGRNIRVNVGDVRVLVESSSEREQEGAMAVARRIALLGVGGAS